MLYRYYYIAWMQQMEPGFLAPTRLEPAADGSELMPPLVRLPVVKKQPADHGQMDEERASNHFLLRQL